MGRSEREADEGGVDRMDWQAWVKILLREEESELKNVYGKGVR